jgi:hypothetical protein
MHHSTTKKDGTNALVSDANLNKNDYVAFIYDFFKFQGFPIHLNITNEERKAVRFLLLYSEWARDPCTYNKESIEFKRHITKYLEQNATIRITISN